jgi:hypothetical protein
MRAGGAPFACHANASDARCRVRVRLRACATPALVGRACLAIDRPFYFAFVALQCFDAQHAARHANDCIEAGAPLRRHVRAYEFAGGLALSTALAERYDPSLPYGNAPATDDVASEYVLSVRPGRQLLLGDLAFTEVYRTPIEAYALERRGAAAPPPPPPAPPPAPSAPAAPSAPRVCTLDFLRASSYYQDLEPERAREGSDGNLVQEFMAVEALLDQLLATVSDAVPSGTLQPYACLVRARPHMECLDVAGASSLQFDGGRSWWEPPALEADASGGLLLHFTALVGLAPDASSARLFGLDDACGGAVPPGDGMVTAFDAFVFAAAQFALGPFAALGRPFDQVTTTRTRNGTADRCEAARAPSRAEWTVRVARDPCAAAPPPPPPAARALAAVEAARAPVGLRARAPLLWRATRAAAIVQPAPAIGPSPFGFPPGAHDASRARARRAGAIVELGARVFAHASDDAGGWWWINLPGVYAAVDLTIEGAHRARRVELSNVRAPNLGARDRPVALARPELRFVRHREFGGHDAAQCAPLVSSRAQLVAFERGTASVAQQLDASKHLCGFDLVLWLPAEVTRDRTDPSCVVAVAAGSSAMGYGGLPGAVQRERACARPFALGARPPPPASSSARGPGDRVAIALVAAAAATAALVTARARPLARRA